MATLAQALAGIVQHNGPRTAIVDRERNFTWAEFGERVGRAAGVLSARGISRGDRFAIHAPNGYRYEELRFAGFRLGAIPVPINWRLAPPEVEHILRDSEVKFVIAEDQFVQAYESDELNPWADGILTLPEDYETLLAKAETPPMAEGISEDDDAILYYTGGTTGRSKGVRLSHKNIISCGVAFGLGVGARPDDVYLHAAPAFHSADLLGTGWMLQGAAQCYMPAFSPAVIFEIIRDYKVTATVLVPAMLMAMVSSPEIKVADVSSLRFLGYGASPMALEWIERVAAAFPDLEFANCYGLTEVSPDLTIFDAREFRAAIDSGDREGKVRSVGKPNALQELRVVGSDGEDVPVGEVGELWARGPNIMNGYLNLPKETEAALADGWFRTGDVARFDEEGYVYLLDRLKDMVITGGENVYTSEVEAALHQHPAVSEAAVFGVPDDKMGEALFAAVVPRPGESLDEENLIEHCRARIGGYKIPRRMDFVEALPKSAMGKVLKTELRKTYG